MGTFQTLREVTLNWAKARANAASSIFLDSVRPIYGANNRSNPLPELIGSCVFLRVGNDHYLVTAAHVVDDADETTLYVAAGEELLPIVGHIHVTAAPNGDRYKDHADFAFMRLGTEILNCMTDLKFLRDVDASLNRADTTKRSYLVLGYPRSLNKKISATERVVRPKPWHYQNVGEAPDSKTLEAIGCNLEHHLFLKYDKNVGNYDGKVIDAIYPKGASGGALIDLGVPTPDSFHPEATCGGRLAGLFIERKSNEKLLVCINIQIILDAIRKTQEDSSSDCLSA